MLSVTSSPKLKPQVLTSSAKMTNLSPAQKSRIATQLDSLAASPSQAAAHLSKTPLGSATGIMYSLSPKIDDSALSMADSSEVSKGDAEPEESLEDRRRFIADLLKAGYSPRANTKTPARPLMTSPSVPGGSASLPTSPMIVGEWPARDLSHDMSSPMVDRGSATPQSPAMDDGAFTSMRAALGSHAKASLQSPITPKQSPARLATVTPVKLETKTPAQMPVTPSNTPKQQNPLTQGDKLI